MPKFTHGQIAEIRHMRRQGMRMAAICRFYQNHHTRDEIVEAIDSIIRRENNHDAVARVNHILSLQASGVPLVNGMELHHVIQFHNRSRYAPMF